MIACELRAAGRVRGAFVVGLLGVLAPVAAGQDIEVIGVHVGQAWFDGQLAATPFSFEAEVVGCDLQLISPIQVQTPGGPLLDLIFDPSEDEWRFLQTGFTTLCAVEAAYGFGDYTFLFNGGGDQVTVAFDPGSPTCATPPITGFGDVASPMHLDSGVDLFPTISWSCAGGTCGSFGWFVEVYPMVGSGAEYDADIPDPGATSWTPPGCLTGGRTYGLYLGTGTVLPGGIQNLVTAMGDAFVYAPGWENSNTIEFDTRPDVGTSYCLSAPNSSDSAARICVAGSATVADQDLTVVAFGCPEDVPGLFYFGPDQLAGGPPFGDGHRCVRVGGSRRVYPFATTGPANGLPPGTAARALDFGAPYAAGLTAGAGVNFQYWFRDSAAGGAGFNLTDGVEVLLQ